MSKTWTVGIFISLLSASLALGAASTNVSFFKGVDADNLVLNELNLGTVANGGTATLVLATNVYRAAFSGATAIIALPSIPIATNDYVLMVKGTNSSGGSQVITFPSLIRDELSGTALVTTITNNTAAAFRLRFESSGGVWRNVDASGDALAFGSGSGVSDNWTASGTTNSTLPGRAFVGFVTATNGVTLPSVGNDQLLGTDSTGNTTNLILGANLTRTGNTIDATGGSVILSGTQVIGITLDGGSNALPVGLRGFIEIPYACQIQKVTMLADVSGSAVVDIWKDTYANYPPTVADTITASAKPTITTALKSQTSTLTGWTTNITAGDILVFNVDSATTITRLLVSLTVTRSSGSTIGITIDGAGTAITTGIKGSIEVPYACTIERATMLANQSGSIVVDIWKDTYANYPPTVADTITAAAKPTITTAIKSQDSTLTGWTLAVAAGDILRFNVDSCTDISTVTLTLKVKQP